MTHHLQPRQRGRAIDVKAANSHASISNILKIAGLAMLVSVLALMSPRAFSAPLNLTPNFPDFVVGSVSYGYVYDGGSETGVLTITGTPSAYTEDPNGSVLSAQVTGGSFSLSATLDKNGVLQTGGSFTLDGVVRYPFPTALYDSANHPTNNLLQGNLSQVGWVGNTTDSGGFIEFTYNNADGYIANAAAATSGTTTLLDLGAVTFTGGGMKLIVNSSDLGTGNFGAWDTTWNGTGVANVWVPVPAAAWLFGSALLGLFGLRRRVSIN